MTIEQYQQYVANMPKAAHNMEHVSNFGNIVAKGFELVAATIERSMRGTTRDLIHAFGGEHVDVEALHAKQAAAREARKQKLLNELEELEQDDA